MLFWLGSEVQNGRGRGQSCSSPLTSSRLVSKHRVLSVRSFGYPFALTNALDMLAPCILLHTSALPPAYTGPSAYLTMLGSRVYPRFPRNIR